MYALSLDIAYAQKLFPAFLHSTNRRGHSVTNIPHEATVSLRLARRFIDGLQEAAFPFEALLQDILRYQGKHNPPLSAYWKSKGFDSGEVRDFDEVPAVPTDVFRYVELCSNEAPPQGVFRTSGTTSGARGQHFHLSTLAYDAGAIRHFQNVVLGQDQKTHFVHVAFPPRTHPDSSLSHMLRVFGEALGRDARSLDFYFEEEGLRVDALKKRLNDAVAEGEPITLFGTAFGLADTLDHLSAMQLPKGSRIIQTGGFKGRREALEPSEFYLALAQHYGLQVGAVLAEYGMTELSSQLYSNLQQPAETPEDSASRRLLPPPWCRVDACDPETLRVLPQGERGLLRFSDCANIDSAAIIQSSDLGIVHPDGIELIGRMPGATPRGCSLAIEELRSHAPRR